MTDANNFFGGGGACDSRPEMTSWDLVSSPVRPSLPGSTGWTRLVFQEGKTLILLIIEGPPKRLADRRTYKNADSYSYSCESAQNSARVHPKEGQIGGLTN